MSNTMLHGVLCMPPDLWAADEISTNQRYGRYLQASETIRKQEDEIDELTLMLDIFNSSIVTGVLPLKGSDCHKKILELMERNGRKATAGSWE